jgi:TetR/AcrR family transcriptional regulator, transcriptional repressor of bet genes
MKSIVNRPRRQRLPEAERREQIVRAALEVARKEGLQAVTARSVAKAAGLSQGLVFFHFESTELLLAALVSHLTHQTLEAGPRPEDFAGLPGATQLPEFLGARLASVEQGGAHQLIDLLVEAWVAGLRAPGTRRGVQEAAKQYLDTFRPIARAAITAEPGRFSGVTEAALASTVLSLVLGAAVQAAIDPAAWDPAAIRSAVRALVGGGRPPRGPDGRGEPGLRSERPGPR